MDKMIRLLDGSQLKAGLTGPSGAPVLMLPVAKESVYGQEADHLRQWGVDPELGEHFIAGLRDKFQVLYFDYEGHRLRQPNPLDLTASSITEDFLTIAGEMNVSKFSYYGYSWLALAGLQLAIRTDRLESLLMGGFPPLDGPYAEMLIVTNHTYMMALSQPAPADPAETEQKTAAPEATDWDNIQIQMVPEQTRQFVTLYESLADFRDRDIQHLLRMPRLAFAGEQDKIVYGDNFGGVTVDIAGKLVDHQSRLEQLGWDVAILKGSGMDHTKAMQPETVLPVLRPWLIRNVLRES
ncbi:alpha/beta hydrolase [Paenibacillus sp. FSL K6-1217]|uniref:alpha/beta fold hydrolase n=1 Tax=Paenibacillus sp. FSL K6-1217 TaxID=2921466 RepID=UPI0032523092